MNNNNNNNNNNGSNEASLLEKKNQDSYNSTSDYEDDEEDDEGGGDSSGTRSGGSSSEEEDFASSSPMRIHQTIPPLKNIAISNKNSINATTSQITPLNSSTESVASSSSVNYVAVFLFHYFLPFSDPPSFWNDQKNQVAVAMLILL